MRQVLTILALLISTISQAEDVDITKFCLDKFCLGDSAAKHGGFKSFKTYNDVTPLSYRVRPVKAPHIPVCGSNPEFFMVLPVGQNPNAKSFFYITLAPFPEHLAEGVDNYYRVIGITTRFPKVSNADLDAIADKVFTRAGAKIQTDPMGGFISGSIRLSTYVMDQYLGKNTSAVSLQNHGIMGFNSKYKDSIAQQTGCLNESPLL